MIKLGSIILSNNIKDPCVIIRENKYSYVAIKLENTDDDDFSHYLLGSNMVVKNENYNGHKLDKCNACYIKTINICNLGIREIGHLTDQGYFKLLKGYVNYNAYMGATDPSYLTIRDDIHEQLRLIIDSRNKN